VFSVGLHGAVYPDFNQGVAGRRILRKLQSGGSKEWEAELAPEVVATTNHA
jgi:hypothetical protein